jgi:SAM-dependent methyltransferase
MHPQIIEYLRCPRSGSRLTLQEPSYQGGLIESGRLLAAAGDHCYSIKNFIPRFVPASNYADNFGMQWNKFRRTQLDSYSGLSISTDRFWKATGWTPQAIRGKLVLDIGCGAGRFAEVALSAGATVVALDYSSAVDACYANLAHFENLHVVQGDIYALPFAREAFPYVYSLGVLQHTPDVSRAFAALPPMVTPGGRLCVDFYEKSWKSLLMPKYWLRPITRRIRQDRLFAALERWVPRLLPISRAVSRVPLIGNSARHFVPVVNYEGVLPLSPAQHLEWSLLDTFDWLAPAFDNPQTARTVAAWLRGAGMQQIEVLKAGHLVGRGMAANATGN